MRTQKEMDMSPDKMWRSLYFFNLLPRNIESNYSFWIRTTQIADKDFNDLCKNMNILFFGV